MQQAGTRSTAVTMSDITTPVDVNDDVVREIERTIVMRFFHEMLDKCLQLVQFEWIPNHKQGISLIK